MPTWDLAVVLKALSKAPFEPLEEVTLRFLRVKTVFLLAISSLKRVSDLQALSVAPSCLEFASVMARAFLYPRYVPKSALSCSKASHSSGILSTSLSGFWPRKAQLCVSNTYKNVCTIRGESRTNYFCVMVLVRKVFLLTSRPSAGG